MKQCPQCEKQFDDDIRHCSSCGARLFRPAERPCTKCGMSNELGTRNCRGCGSTLMPSVVQQRKPNSSKEPEMPEWVTRFAKPPATAPEDQSPKPDEGVEQVMALLRRILGLAPNEISSIQIRKKDGKTIELSTDPSEQVEIKRTTDFRWR